MTVIREGHLEFRFAAHLEVAKYDAWQFYRRFKDACAGNKGVDVLALDRQRKALWLIEVKDYRHHPREKAIALGEEVARKVRDTLAGIFAAKVNAQEPAEQRFAEACLRAKRVNVVLHADQPARASKLFPRAYDPADLQSKLKQLLKPIDAHPRVASLSAPMSGTSWEVVSVGGGES